MSAQTFDGIAYGTFADRILGFKKIAWNTKTHLEKFVGHFSSATSILKIWVSFSIFNNLQSAPVAGLNYIDSEPMFRSSLKSLLADNSLSDFVIECGTNKFPCHKAILASRSDVFATLFSTNDWAENKENAFPIKDHSPDVVKQMLEFIYTNKIPEGTTFSLNLLIIADQFNLKGLIQLCESELSKNMTHQNAIEVL